MTEVNQERLAMDQLKRSWQIQAVLYDLACVLLEDISLMEALRLVVYRITSIPWLALESRGGIFLVKEDPSVLVLTAHRGLPLSLQSICARVPLGRCLCGRAALSGRMEFADSVDERHENRWQGMRQHGHYCVPIMSGHKVVGVVYLHLKEGHRRDEKEEEFLGAVANLLTGIISRKQMEEELAQRNVALEQKVREISALNALFQQHLAMRQEREAAYERLVQDIHRMAGEASKLVQEARQLEPPTPAMSLG